MQGAGQPAHSSRGLRYWVSLDCGQAHDYSAALVSERVTSGHSDQKSKRLHFSERVQSGQSDHSAIHIGSISRAPLRTPYPKIAKAVVSKCCELEPVGAFGERPDIGLIIDAGGVGRAVRDLVRDEIRKLGASAPRIHFWPVAATGGGRVTISGGFINVPKKDLVTSAVVALQDGTLKIGDVENADVLRKELAEYRVKLTKKGNETYEGAGRNDDLVYGLALATWAWSFTSNREEHHAGNRGNDPFESLRHRGRAL